MAENEIDKLSINIEVVEKNVAERINQITLAVDNLTKSIKGFDKITKLLSKTGTAKSPTNVANNLSNTLKVAQDKVETPSTAEMPKVMTGGERTKSELESVKNKVEELQSVIKTANATIYSEEELLRKKISDTTKEFNRQVASAQKLAKKGKDVSEISKSIEETSNSLASQRNELEEIVRKKSEELEISRKAKREQDRLNNRVGNFQKLTRSIIRVGFYRVIRGALSSTVNAFKEGIENLRSGNAELDSSLNKISASSTALKNSLASLIAPLINTLEPVITSISDNFANFVNRINEAKAAMSGQTEYTKILTSDTEEYQKALEKTNGTLLEFDKFTTLATKNSGYTGTIQSPVGMNTDEAKQILNSISQIKQIIIDIGLAIAAIGAYKIVKWITGGGIKDLFKGIKDIYSSLSPLAALIGGIFVAIDGIVGIINWDETTSGLRKVLDILKIVFGVVAGIAATIAMFTGMTTAGKIAKAVAIGATAAGIITTAVSAIPGYKDGGTYERGDFFKANENGITELITSTNNGGGSVMNLSQWQQVSEIAFYNALYRYNAKQNGDNANGMSANELGTMIAGNVGFRNEMNRRNVNLNLK